MAKEDKRKPTGDEPVHIIGSVLVECPKCQNKDLIMGYKGFFRVVPGKQAGKMLDPQTVFLCADEEGHVCNIFDIGDWYNYYKAKEGKDDKNAGEGKASADDETRELTADDTHNV